MHETGVVRAPSDPALAPPARSWPSVRRTSTLLMTWPEGIGGTLRLLGRARDLLTGPDGTPSVLASATLHVDTKDREILSIVSDPPVPGLDRLVGARAGGSLRSAIVSELPDEAEAGTPLYLLLDDLAGATLISAFTLIRWRPPDQEYIPRRGGSPMAGVCAGYRLGGVALDEEGTARGVGQNVAVVPTLNDPTDPLGWHQLDDHPPMAMRRARRIDVTADGDDINIDAMFRDSCWDPDGTEIAVHEYELRARAGSGGQILQAVDARPRVLPYLDCPAAAPNAQWLLGAPMGSLRKTVLERLRGTDSCTHLNDALRALAEVPILAGSL